MALPDRAASQLSQGLEGQPEPLRQPGSGDDLARQISKRRPLSVADRHWNSVEGGSKMADKIRLGLIGASVSGTWSSHSHLPAVRASAEVELTAVCTTRADSAEAARQAYGARLAFDDYRKMV